MIDPRRNRISVAIRVRIHELGYVILMFLGWFLFAGNIIYMVKGASSFRDWGELVLHMIHTAGIQRNRDYHAEGWLGISFTIITSMAGLVFAGVWIAIFMSDFAIIFGKDIEDRKLRLMLASGKHRTIRLRRTRRKDM